MPVSTNSQGAQLRDLNPCRENTNQRDGSFRILFHDPVSGFWDHPFFHLARCKAHAPCQEGFVIDGVLIGCELREARVHGARARVEPGVVPPGRLAKSAWAGGELVPEPVEVDPLAPSDQPLHVGAAEPEMP
jgi:hypothetical protein